MDCIDIFMAHFMDLIGFCFSVPIFMFNVDVTCVEEYFILPFLVYFVHIVFYHCVPVLK